MQCKKEVVFEGVEQLNDFYAENKETLGTDFEGLLDKYDASYFENQILIAVPVYWYPKELGKDESMAYIESIEKSKTDYYLVSVIYNGPYSERYGDDNGNVYESGYALLMIEPEAGVNINASNVRIQEKHHYDMPE